MPLVLGSRDPFGGFTVSDYVLPHADRGANMEGFTAWVEAHGVDTEAVSIDKFEEGGFGLKANRDIKV